MPHILVEYTKDLNTKIPALLSELHSALAAQDVEMERIKTRGHQIDHAVVGEMPGNKDMIHITLSILAGRDLETKKKYGDALKAVLDRNISSSATRTMEIRDMDPDTYYL